MEVWKNLRLGGRFWMGSYCYLYLSFPHNTLDIKRNTDFMWMKNENWEYYYKENQTVQINWKNYETSELWNFLIWLNWQRTWFSLEDINNMWRFVEDKIKESLNTEEWINAEKYDQQFYKAWYIYWVMEESWEYSEEELELARDKLLEKAKNSFTTNNNQNENEEDEN